MEEEYDEKEERRKKNKKRRQPLRVNNEDGGDDGEGAKKIRKQPTHKVVAGEESVESASTEGKIKRNKGGRPKGSKNKPKVDSDGEPIKKRRSKKSKIVATDKDLVKMDEEQDEDDEENDDSDDN